MLCAPLERRIPVLLDKVFISGKSGVCAITYLLLRMKYCTFWISEMGCISWQNSVCDERHSVFCESWFYQLHWSLRPQSWLAEYLLHSPCEKPEVVQLRKTCHTWAFHGTGGSWPWMILFSVVEFCVVFHLMGRERIWRTENDVKRKSLLPMQVLDLPLKITFIGLLFPHKKIHAVKSVFVMSAS